MLDTNFGVVVLGVSVTTACVVLTDGMAFRVVVALHLGSKEPG